MNLFEIAAVLTLNKSSYDSGIKAAKTAAQGLTGFLKSAVSTISGLTVKGVTAAVGGIGYIVKNAVEEYSQFEQMMGGVEKLFGTTAQSVEQYARMTGASFGESLTTAATEFENLKAAQDAVAENASNAWKTVGMSANQYMSNAIDLGNMLIMSLDGDTQQAAGYVDMAMRDLADSANTYGKPIEELAGVYSSLARGIYTTIDNLRLGYGQGKEAVEKMIADANKMKEANGEAADLTIDRFADVVEAIHLVQTAQHVSGLSAEEAQKMVEEGLLTEEQALYRMGTTAREAQSTVQGSLSQTKAAWQNILEAVADPKQDIGQKIDDFVESLTKTIENIEPVVERSLKGAGKLLTTIIPKAIEFAKDFISENGDDIVAQVESLISNILFELRNIPVDDIADAIKNWIPRLIGLLQDGFETFSILGITVINAIVDALGDNSGDIVDAIVSTVTLLVDKINDTDHLSKINDAAVKIVLALMDGLTEAAPELLPAAVEAILKSIEEITKPENITQIVNMAIILFGAVVDGLYTAGLPLGRFAWKILSNLGTAIVELLPEVALSWIQSALRIATNIIKNLPEEFSKLVSTIWDNFKDNSSLDDIETQIENFGGDLLDDLAAGVEEAWDDFMRVIDDIIQWIVDSFALDEAWEWGKSIIKDIEDGISNAWDTAKTFVESIPEKIRDFFDFSDSESWGSNIINGFIRGIKSKWDEAKRTVEGIVSFVKQVFTGGFQIKSPSKWAEKTFRYVMEGAEIGLERGQDSLTDRAGSVVDEVKDRLSQPLSISADVNRDVQTDPNITTIAALLTQYLPLLAQMKVELDSGVLVGALTPGIDAELGRRSEYVRRGMA